MRLTETLKLRRHNVYYSSSSSSRHNLNTTVSIRRKCFLIVGSFSMLWEPQRLRLTQWCRFHPVTNPWKANIKSKEKPVGCSNHFESISCSNLSLQVRPNEASPPLATRNRLWWVRWVPLFTTTCHHEITVERALNCTHSLFPEMYVKSRKILFMTLFIWSSCLNFSKMFSWLISNRISEGQHQIGSKGWAKLWKEAINAHHESHSRPRL